jgi:hypothetical protein
VISIFERLHPNTLGLFQFDSSSNHHAMAMVQFIEPWWGSGKHYMRANCEYNIGALRKIIPEALRVTSIGTI